MVVLGSLFPVMDFSSTSLENRLLSIAAILTSAALVRLARTMRDMLLRQTLGAQAADRLKTQIFANLSHELRTPLNAIIGFADLLLADCRADQQSSLHHIRFAGRRLLVTIENLLDLAQTTERVLRADRLDLAAILRQSIEAARGGTGEQRVTLVNGIAADTPAAIGDGWATRRIADNLIGNALKFTQPGRVRRRTGYRRGHVARGVAPTWRTVFPGERRHGPAA
jgi:signal transduction histidine kinase